MLPEAWPVPPVLAQEALRSQPATQVFLFSVNNMLDSSRMGECHLFAEDGTVRVGQMVNFHGLASTTESVVARVTREELEQMSKGKEKE